MGNTGPKEAFVPQWIEELDLPSSQKGNPGGKSLEREIKKLPEHHGSAGSRENAITQNLWYTE